MIAADWFRLQSRIGHAPAYFQLQRAEQLIRSWEAGPAPCGIPRADPYQPCLPGVYDGRLACLTCGERQRLAITTGTTTRSGDPDMTYPIPIRRRCSGLCTVHCLNETVLAEIAGLDTDPDDQVAGILDDIEAVDRHLDEAAPRIFRAVPGDSEELIEIKTLLNRYRRIAAGPVSESVESVDALNLATGGNPRKGVIGGEQEILGELGDTACSALLAIQSITKDTAVTWQVFLAALAKARSRVPDGSPS